MSNISTTMLVHRFTCMSMAHTMLTEDQLFNVKMRNTLKDDDSIEGAKERDRLCRIIGEISHHRKRIRVKLHKIRKQYESITESK